VLAAAVTTEVDGVRLKSERVFPPTIAESGELTRPVETAAQAGWWGRALNWRRSLTTREAG
jgi:hypothetical protein